MTGEGEMFISAKEYIVNGIKLLGAEKFSEGLITVLKDPEFEDVQSAVAVVKITEENLDPELATYLQYILNKWQQGDENIRGWLKIQLNGISGSHGEIEGKKS